MAKIRLDDPPTFLEEYGVELVDTSNNDEKKCVCPFHDDATPSCGVNIEKQVFNCPVCASSGDLVDLAAGVMKVKRATIMEHVKLLAKSDDSEPIDAGLIESWHTILKSSKMDLDLVKTRKGITIGTLNSFLIGKDGDRFTIPIRNTSGKFINVRKWSPTDKKRKVINLRGHGRRYLFPIQNLDKDTIIITEGEFKALLLIQMGFNALSPTGGASTWSPSWNALFQGKIVYIMYDVDGPGKRGAQTVARHLFQYAKEVRVVDLPIDAIEYPKGDITDFVVQMSMGIEDIQSCLNKAQVWRPDPLFTKVDEDPKVYDVHLHDSSKAEFYHKRVRVTAVVSAKDTAPYIIPEVSTVMCPRDRDFCAMCPIYNQPQEKVQITIDNMHPAILSLVGIKSENMGNALKAVAGIPRRCEVCKFTVEKTQNVEEVRLVPEIRIKNDAEEDNCHVVRRAFYVGHGLETNTSYLMEARVVPEPQSQYATLIVYDAKASVDSLTTFNCTPELISKLKAFTPKEWTLAGIKEKLDVLYEDLEANVTRIYQRRDLHTFYDLIYHSPLLMRFQGKVVRGWMEGLVIGDSGQGKSETVSNLLRHYQLGEKIDSKGATVAGLMGGMQETSKRWFVTWGIIPLNDRRLVILEEVKGMATQVIEKLTDMRSSGVAELAKIEKAKTNARTRLIWISNPRSDQQIKAYNFGIYAVKELFGALEDVRRLDMAIVVASGDVPSSVLNIRDANRPVSSSTFDSDVCRDLILWAWSRKADQVQFEPEATEAILAASEKMGSTYVSSIPLVEAADQRLKLARMAAAIAARTFSTDETGSCIVVRKCHAEFVHAFLDRIYSNPTFGYSDYSRLIQGENRVSDPQEIMDLVKGLANAKDVIRSLLDWQGFSVPDWMDVTEHDKDEARMALGILVRKNAIKRGRGGLYYKCPPFIAMLRQLDMETLSNESRAVQVNKGDF